MRKPADLDVLFRLAAWPPRSAIWKDAISALERMLRSPNLPRVRLELGVLYFRLGSYEVARSYLESALRSPTVPADVRRRAEEYLAEVGSKLAIQPDRRCLLRLALPVQRQPRPGGVARAAVRPAGQPQPGRPRHGRLGRRELAAGPSSLGFRPPGQVGAGDPVRRLCQPAVPALGRQRLAARPDTGPRFSLQRRHEDISLRPFVTGGYVWVNDTSYSELGAVGSRRRAAGQRPAQRHGPALPRQDNQDTSYLPANSQYPRHVAVGQHRLQYEIGSVAGVVRRGNVQRSLPTSRQGRATACTAGRRLLLRFPDPLLRTGLPWTINFSASRAMVGLRPAMSSSTRASRVSRTTPSQHRARRAFDARTT